MPLNACISAKANNGDAITGRARIGCRNATEPDKHNRLGGLDTCACSTQANDPADETWCAEAVVPPFEGENSVPTALTPSAKRAPTEADAPGLVDGCRIDRKCAP